MEIDIEPLREAFKKLAHELYRVIAKWVSNYWEQLKEIAEEYMKYKLDLPVRPVYGQVKDKVMKSQVLDRKPKCIRARTVC